MTTRHRIIGPELLEGADGANINGPSCIEVPLWCEGRLGRYYLYFAHHRGSHIRLAYANNPRGPWKLHPGGVLDLCTLPQCRDHIASPEVVIDPESGEIRMYFHGFDAQGRGQATFFARSDDGLHFTAAPQPIAPFYLRVVFWRDIWIGMSKGGVISVSQDGKSAFRLLSTPAFPISASHADAPGTIRHVALLLKGDRLWILFTRIGDAPEHIRLGYIDLLRPMDRWRVEESVPLLMPERDWEGAQLPLVPSRGGAAGGIENALRDPAVLRTEEGDWLFYSFAGESGIAATALPDLATCFIERPRIAHWPAGSPAHSPRQHTEAALRQLAQPGALVRRLSEIDGPKSPQRIFLMGCGRSGTWLRTSIMSCFDDTAVVAKELPVEAFGIVESDRQNIVLKRAWNSYKRLDAIPPSIGIIWIVRHPFDVLTSHNPVTARKYHISPERWVGEILALKKAMESGRSNVLVLRYEDMVRDPQDALSRIAVQFGLIQMRDASEAMHSVSLPPEGVAAMHGVRPVDRNSVGRYLHAPDALDHLREIVPHLGSELAWVSEVFGYDVSLSLQE